MRKRGWIVVGLVVALVGAVAILAYSWFVVAPPATWPTIDLTDGKDWLDDVEFEEAGTLYVHESPDYSIDRAVPIRDLTVEETEAFRHFLRAAEYDEFESLYKDHADVPIVRIDGVYLWVYRSSIYRFEHGDRHKRLVVDGLKLTKDDPMHEIDFAALLVWHRSQGD